MQRLLLFTLLLLRCGPVLPGQAEGNGPLPSDFVLPRLWLTGPDDRVIGFDGRELPRFPMPDGEHRRILSLEELVLGDQPQQERQPDPLVPNPRRAEPLEMPIDQPERRFEPSFVASDLCGMIVFALGLVGWIALGVAVVIVERKR
jgi:hypothetical protein